MNKQQFIRTMNDILKSILSNKTRGRYAKKNVHGLDFVAPL